MRSPIGRSATRRAAPPSGLCRRGPAPSNRSRQAFLPYDLDPTVFDEGFLRQLERLGC